MDCSNKTASASAAMDMNRNSALKALYPCVRFVPKKTSMRAITNMKSVPYTTGTGAGPTVYNIPTAMPSARSASGSGTTSAPLPFTLTNNASLYNVLHVLRHLYQHHHPSACGFGVSGVEEACERFKTFRLLQQQRTKLDGASENKATVESADGSTCAPQPYYVAVLDLEKCFDRVDTSRLYDVVSALVMGPSSSRSKTSRNQDQDHDQSRSASRSARSPTNRSPLTHASSSSTTSVPEEHLIHKYNVSLYLPSAERFVSRSIRRVSSADDFQSFQEASESLSESHHNAIISDGVVYPSMSRDELLKILRQHLFQHAVRMPEESRRKRKRSATSDLLYTQVRGIPQGSALSPLLCNLYYGHVEKDTFGSCEQLELLSLTDLSTLIVRVMDDYLIISTRKQAVTHFLQRAHTCFKPFGGGFNPSKTKVNFDIALDVEGRQVTLPRISGPEVCWCGFNINHSSLEISPSFGKLFGSGIGYSITRDCSHAGVAFRRALKGFIRPKFQAIILDASINKFVTVTKSIYSLFLTAAVRADMYLRAGANSLQLSLKKQNIAFICGCIREVIHYGARLVLLRGHQSSRKMSKLLSSQKKLFPFSWDGISTFSFMQDERLDKNIFCDNEHDDAVGVGGGQNGSADRAIFPPALCSLSQNQVNQQYLCTFHDFSKHCVIYFYYQ